MKKTSFLKNYGFLLLLLLGIVLGCITGAIWPGATVLEPLGTVFINMMFCVVVPLVFSSISGAILNMRDAKRAGKIIVSTILIFLLTGAIACSLELVLLRFFPPVPVPWANLTAGTVDEQTDIATLIVNFFTVNDFNALLSRKAMLPLIVFSIIFGICVSKVGGPDHPIGKWINGLTDVMLQFVQIITYYAPIAFFGFFASLVATYGPQLVGDYGRAMLLVYPSDLIYSLTFFALYAWIGGGRDAVRLMYKNLLRPFVTALGTCSSTATMPTTMAAARNSYISSDIAELVVPLGATMHMDGACISAALKVVFMYGVFGWGFPKFGTLILIVVVACLSSVAFSGVPGGGYIGEYLIAVIFFPSQMAIAYPILVTLGNIFDPASTAVNASGDFVICFWIERIADGKGWLQKKIAAAAEKKEASV